MAEIIKAATRDGYGKALVELGAINDKLVVLEDSNVQKGISGQIL